MRADIMLMAATAGAGIRIAVLHRRLRALEQQVIRDPLTGAFNRRHMHVTLAAAIDRRSRFSERASLLVIDVDRFKDVNDSLGHAEGDRVLKTMVALLGQRLRKLDALFRAGGEEFVVLLPATRFIDAVALAEDLRRLVQDAGITPGRHLSISVGVVELTDGQTVPDWLADADAALYRAKRGGRNRVAGRFGAAPHRREERQPAFHSGAHLMTKEEVDRKASPRWHPWRAGALSVLARRIGLLSACLVAGLLAPLTAAAQAPPEPSSSCPRCIECADEAAGPRTLRVKVYNRSPLDPAGLAAVFDVTNRIWLPNGIRIERVTDLDAVAVIVSEGQRASAPADVRAVLGETLFSQHHATPYIRLWLGAAEAAANATPVGAVPFHALRREERAAILRRMLGVALAHELAHYLLDTEKHSPRGLLRQALTVRDLQQPDLTRLEVSLPQQGLMCSAARR